MEGPTRGSDDPWIDITCFQPPPDGQFGTAGVGILRGPGYWNWDLGISKNLHLDDKRYFTLPGRGLQRPQPPELGRAQLGHLRPG